MRARKLRSVILTMAAMAPLACGASTSAATLDNSETAVEHLLSQPGSPMDAAFVQTTAARALAQIDLADQAMESSESAEVKNVAQRVKQDASQMYDQMQDVAQRQGIDIPTTTGRDQPYFCGGCVGTQGVAFDRQYVTYQVYEMPRMINDLRYVSYTSAYVPVRNWASGWDMRMSGYMPMIYTVAPRYNVYYPYAISTYRTYYYPTYYPYTVAYRPTGYNAAYYPTYYPYGVTYYPTARSYVPYGTSYCNYGCGGYSSYPYGRTYYPYSTWRATLFADVGEE